MSKWYKIIVQRRKKWILRAPTLEDFLKGGIECNFKAQKSIARFIAHLSLEKKINILEIFFSSWQASVLKIGQYKMKSDFSTVASHFKSFGVEGNQKTKMAPKKPRGTYSILYESPVEYHYLKSIDSKLLY